MKTRTIASGLASFGLIVGSAAIATNGAHYAAPVSQSEAEQKTMSGIIESVSAEDSSFVLIVDDSPESDSTRVTVKVDEDTAYTLNGKSSTMKEALKAERKATARTEDGVASQVNVTTRDTISH